MRNPNGCPLPHPAIVFSPVARNKNGIGPHPHAPGSVPSRSLPTPKAGISRQG